MLVGEARVYGSIRNSRAMGASGGSNEERTKKRVEGNAEMKRRGEWQIWTVEGWEMVYAVFQFPEIFTYH